MTPAPTILLINPPAAKPCEAPAGIARLAGALADRGIGSAVLDLNLHCLTGQFDVDLQPEDRWSRRAFRNRAKNLALIRSLHLYRSRDRYRRVVGELGRVLAVAGARSGCTLTLADFHDPGWSPLSSSDLLASAACFERNYFYPSFAPLLHEALERHRPAWVGLSLSYLSQALAAFAVAGFIRRHYPGVHIVAGGGLLTSWMRSPAWREPFGGLIDCCVDGPGERRLLGLLGADAAPELGRFCYDGFALDGYLAPGPVLPYAASHGCYWQKCSFCPDFAEGTCYRAKAAAVAHRELSGLCRHHQPLLVHLLDNALSPALLRLLAASAPLAPWYGFARFEKDLADPDFCLALRRSGCVMLKLGLESGSQRVLDRLHKGIDLARAATVLGNLRRAGIASYVYLLFGTPAETEADALLTLEFVRHHQEEITFLNLALFNMPVGSPEAAGFEHRFSAGDLSLYCDFVHPHGWDRRAVRTFLQKKFRKELEIRRIEVRNPGVFGSNHAPFLLD